MKKLNVTVVYSMVGMSSIMVPDDMSIEDAIQYAKEHINEIPTPNPNNSDWVSDSDQIDEENCDFEFEVGDTLKFIDFINQNLIKNEDEYDAIIGDVEMSHTLGMCSNWKITDYCMEQYGDLLNSNCKIINDSTVEVFYDNYKKGERFCAAMAGYIGAKEFDKLFGTHDAED